MNDSLYYEKWGRFYIPDFYPVNNVLVYECFGFNKGLSIEICPESVYKDLWEWDERGSKLGNIFFQSPLETNLGKSLYE